MTLILKYEFSAIATTAKEASLKIAVKTWSMEHGFPHDFLQQQEPRKSIWHPGAVWILGIDMVFIDHPNVVLISLPSSLPPKKVRRDLCFCVFKFMHDNTTKIFVCLSSSHAVQNKNFGHLFLFSKHLVWLKIKQTVQVE